MNKLYNENFEKSSESGTTPILGNDQSDLFPTDCNQRLRDLINSIEADNEAKQFLVKMTTDTEDDMKDGMRIFEQQDCLVSAIYCQQSHEWASTVRSLNMMQALGVVSTLSKRFYLTQPDGSINSNQSMDGNLYFLVATKSSTGKSTSLKGIGKRIESGALKAGIHDFPINEIIKPVIKLRSDAALEVRLRKFPVMVATMDEAENFMSGISSSRASEFTKQLETAFLTYHSPEKIEGRLLANNADQSVPAIEHSSLSIIGATTEQSVSKILFANNRETSGYNNRNAIFCEPWGRDEVELGHPCAGDIDDAIGFAVRERWAGNNHKLTTTSPNTAPIPSHNLFGYCELALSPKTDDDEEIPERWNRSMFNKIDGVHERKCEVINPNDHFRYVGYESGVAQRLSNLTHALRRLSEENAYRGNAGFKELLWLARAKDHLVKFALLIAVGRYYWENRHLGISPNNNRPVISDRDIDKAELLLRYCSYSYRYFYHKNQSAPVSQRDDDHLKRKEKTLELIERSGPNGIDRSKLLKKSKLTAEALNTVINNLIGERSIKSVIDSNKTIYFLQP